MKAGLFFGSYNPIHIGHLAIANYFTEFTDISQVWFVVSPQNPLKEKTTLLNDYQRLRMVNIAIENSEKFRSTNIEFKLPKPSFTIDTLTYLKEKYPSKSFALIIGGDNAATFDKWKNYNEIIRQFEIYVYPRPGIDINEVCKKYPSFQIVNAPLVEISSSFIRNAVKEKKDIRHFLPEKVWEYIKEMHFYEK
jgi:nicotinate-nucleotide adenylyltransferase